MLRFTHKKKTLGDAFRTLYKEGDQGLKYCFNNEDDLVLSFEGESAQASTLRKRLQQMEHEGLRLLESQVESIVNTVYRPPVITSSYNGSDDDVRSLQAAYDSVDDDIGTMVVNDLFAGSGKTLAMAVASLLMCSERGEDIRTRREQIRMKQRVDLRTAMAAIVGMRMEVPVTPETYNNSVVVFCPVNTQEQWEKEFELARALTGVAHTDVPVHLHSSRSDVKKYEFVGVLVCDEIDASSRERIYPNCKVEHVHNIGTMRQVALCGRFIGMSATANRFADGMYCFSRQSVLRRLTGGVQTPRPDEINLPDSKKVAATILLSSLLPTQQREAVLERIAAPMDAVPLHEFTVRFSTQSLTYRLFGEGAEIEYNPKEVVERIHEHYHVDLAGCASIDDMLARVQECVRVRQRNPAGYEYASRMARLGRLQTAIESMRTCPVCLEGERDMVLLRGCVHAFCKVCIDKWCASHRVCPTCRTAIAGYVEVQQLAGMAAVAAEVVVLEGEHILEGMSPVISSLRETIKDVMGHVVRAAKEEQQSLHRVLFIISRSSDQLPYTVVLRDSSGIDSVDFLDGENQKKKARTANGALKNNQLEQFQRREQGFHVLLVNEGAGDNVTGVNFQFVDTLITIDNAAANHTQRVGRLTRIGVTGQKTIINIVPSNR